MITSTSLSFLTLAVGLFFCGWRFLMVYQKKTHDNAHRAIALLIALHFAGSVFQNGVMGLGLLLFVKNPVALSYVVIISNLLVLIPALIGVYASYHIFSPHSSPYPLMAVAILVWLIMLGASIADPPKPFLTAENSIDLSMSFPLSVSTFYLLLISIGSNAYIFTRLFRAATERTIRNMAALLAALAWLGVLNVFIRLIVLYHSAPSTRTRFLDIELIIIGLGFIIALVIAPKVRVWLRPK